MIEIASFLSALALKRPIFHSEADFQHAFAWRLHEQFPDATVRLEYPVKLDQWIYLDIWLKSAELTLAIELKYKTASLQIDQNGETYHLKNQSAQDCGRYDFLKDVYRLEQITRAVPHALGLAIILTNDSGYWSKGKENTVDADFRLHKTRKITGLLSWSSEASPGTTRGRNASLDIAGQYLAEWHDYSQVSGNARGHFRYLAFEIGDRA